MCIIYTRIYVSIYIYILWFVVLRLKSAVFLGYEFGCGWLHDGFVMVL